VANRYWFRQRRRGFGATPITWEGWLATLVFLVIVLGLDAGIIIEAPTDRAAAAPLVIIVILVIVAFCAFAASKTEGGWRWRWGGRD
jgi:hypothetical protein